MFRLAPSLAILATASIGLPAVAADYGAGEWSGMDFRSSYGTYEPKDWTAYGEDDDGIHIETGLRYWYSMGSQGFDLAGAGGGSFESEDTAHSVEAHLRIEDDATATYAKGWAGYSAAITGDHSGPTESGEIVDGVLGYAGADFGWNMFNDGKGNGVGGFVGYNYWNNSPRTSRSDFTPATSSADIDYDPDTGIWTMPGDSEDDRLEYHMLRLGLSGKAEFNNFFDITAEVAAVPYAKLGGVLGGHAGPYDAIGTYPGCGIDSCDPYFFKGSTTEVDGWGYGGMAEIMAGIKPTENLTIRLGGRAWYLQGTYDATWRQVTVVPPVQQPLEGDPPTLPDPLYSEPELSEQLIISTENPFSAFRYGLLAEITYAF